MKKIFLISVISIQLAFGQNPQYLTLSDCYNKAIENYPLLKAKKLLANTSELEIKIINSAFLPNLNFSVQASYQSDVTALDMEVPIPNFTIGELSKDQYKTYVEINQLIYDGGMVKSFRNVESANLAIETQNIEIEFFKLKERINQIFFVILLMQENEKVLEIMRDELEKNLFIVESGYKNGVLLESDLALMQAELLKLEQQLLEIQTRKSNAIDILGKYLDKDFNDSLKLELPQPQLENLQDKSRPEQVLLDLQTLKIQATSKFVEAKYKPILVGFGQIGYGRPGLNMLSNKFDSYYIFGAKLSWNFSDWKLSNREQQILQIGEDLIVTQRETFDKNLEIALQNEYSDIQRLIKIIEKDREIIELRIKITKLSSSQLEHGIIKSTDYLNVLNAETQAKIKLETHKIQLIQAKVNYLTLIGD